MALRPACRLKHAIQHSEEAAGKQRNSTGAADPMTTAAVEIAMPTRKAAAIATRTSTRLREPKERAAWPHITVSTGNATPSKQAEMKLIAGDPTAAIIPCSSTSASEIAPPAIANTRGCSAISDVHFPRIATNSTVATVAEANRTM